MTLWRTEVSIDTVLLSIPSATLFPDFQGGYAGASYAFVAEDINPISGNSILTVKLSQIHERERDGPTGANAYFTRMAAGVGSFFGSTSADPYNLVIFEAVGGNFDQDFADTGTGFQAGGILAIEKDTVSGRVSFFTPLATWNTTFGALGISQTTELRPLSIGLLLQAQDIPPASTVGQQLTVDFSHIKGLENGSQISGAAMSTADPGMWGDWTESAIFNLLFTQGFMQNTTAERAGISFPSDPTPSGGADADGWYRIFQGPDHMTAPLPLDLTPMLEHDILFGVWNRMPTNATVRRSHDHGSHWIDVDAENGTPAESLSIQAYAGQVWVCYYDGSQIVAQQSADLGKTWSAAVSISITGTNPRLVIAPDGTFFYFYFSGTTLVLSRSADLGATLLDASPIPITASLTAQDFGAVLAADRSLVVSYIKAGNWESKRSLDWGSSWGLV